MQWIGCLDVVNLPNLTLPNQDSMCSLKFPNDPNSDPKPAEVIIKSGMHAITFELDKEIVIILLILLICNYCLRHKIWFQTHKFQTDTKTYFIHINFQILFNTKIDQTKEVFLITTMQERSFWVLNAKSIHVGKKSC